MQATSSLRKSRSKELYVIAQGEVDIVITPVGQINPRKKGKKWLPVCVEGSLLEKWLW